MSKEYVKNDASGKIKKYLLGFAVGIVATFLSAALFALLMYLMELKSSYAVPFATVSLAIGAFTAAFITSKKVGDRGYLVGLAVGIVFFVIVTLIALVLRFDSVGINTVLRLIIILLASTIGGILGVNHGKNKKYI